MIKKEVPLSYYSAIPADKVLSELNSTSDGLTTFEADKRLKEFGHNTIAKKKRASVVLEFLSHFKSPLLLVLITAAVAAFIFGETVNAEIIVFMILIGVILDFTQEHNANKAAEKLRESVKNKADVLRDSKEKEIDIEHVCLGEIIILEPGALVPADARIISAKDLFVNQSVLTGESVPSEKHSAIVSGKNLSLSELGNIVFHGTSVASGSGLAVVVKTGLSTEFGKISKDLVATPPPTEFEKGVSNFGYLIMKVILFLVLLIFLLNSIIKHNILESFLFAIAIAVGLTPELLPVIMSVNMAKGSLNMAKHGAIVKKQSSIPNFGSMDVLCTDKTGTLTEDKIHLIKYTDVVGKESERVLFYTYINSKYHTGIPNPLDSAVLSFKKLPNAGYEKIDEIPFDFMRRRMSIVAENSKVRVMITKGAPEEVLKVCKAYETRGRLAKLTEDAKKKIAKIYRGLSADGYRVLAVAIKRVPRQKYMAYTKNDENNLELLGFVAFLDPPKKGVKEVIKEMHSMGLSIKILTGDNDLVTKKICKDIGLEVKGVLLGAEIDKLSEQALRMKVDATTIFAKVSPDQKNRVILALKANRHVVGYLGDGINDAPSLKTSDVGISVNGAVDIAKESADIILTHKSLEILKNGILEGRKTFGNTMKYIMMGLSSNFGNMFSVLGAVIFLPFLPMLPVQILLNNFIYDASQITIPTDNVDKEFIQKPKRWNIDFIKRFMLVLGPVSSIFDFLTFYIMFIIFKAAESTFQTGWFIESLATQTLVIHIIRTKQFPFLQSTASKPLLISTIAAVAIGWIIPFTPLGTFFGFSPLPWYVLATIFGLVIVYLILVELVKRWFYKRYDL